MLLMSHLTSFKSFRVSGLFQLHEKSSYQKNVAAQVITLLHKHLAVTGVQQQNSSAGLAHQEGSCLSHGCLKRSAMRLPALWPHGPRRSEQHAAHLNGMSGWPGHLVYLHTQ